MKKSKLYLEAATAARNTSNFADHKKLKDYL